MDLEDRTALVTGASRNIGQAIATELAEQGADVGISARSDERGCQETVERIEATGRRAAIAMADLAESEDITTMVETVRDELGPIDVLVNNATVRPIKPFLEVNADDLDHVIDVNFRGIFRTTQLVVPDMLEQNDGSIVNLLGANVYLGRFGHTHSYGAKMAIEGLIRQLATELGPEGIRVNGLSPGLIDVDRERKNLDAKLASIPLRRMGTVEEIAQACSFLASDRAGYVTGQVLHVNGGRYPTPTTVPDERALHQSR